MSEPIKLVTSKTDQELVDDYKKRLVEIYKPLLDICTEANNTGFAFQIQIGPDAFGRFQIQSCQVIKVYK